MSSLRIATLNCLNLASAGISFYASTLPYSAAEYASKTRWLAALLDQMNADIVLLQEIFHEQALADVVRQMQSRSGAPEWAYCAPWADAQNTRPRLGLIWRATLRPRLHSIAPIAPQCVVQIPELGVHQNFSRPLLQSRWDVPGWPAPLTLINVHLKSRRPAFMDTEDPLEPVVQARAQLRSLLIRATEAAALQQEIITVRAQQPGPLIVAGDFNDTAEAITTRLATDPLWLLAEKGQARLAPSRSSRLLNAGSLQKTMTLPPVTHLHGDELECIDHVYLSEEFAAPQAHALPCVSAVQTFNEHLVQQPTAAVRAVPDPLRLYSDHAGVCVSFEAPASSP